jgi:hypothetical protein
MCRREAAASLSQAFAFCSAMVYDGSQIDLIAKTSNEPLFVIMEF